MFCVKRNMSLTYNIMFALNFNRFRNFSAHQTGVKKEENIKTYESIADFYAGKSVFITGATGFLGKVLVKKLLYNCNDIDKVYLLVRGKKDTNADDRITKMFDNVLFEKLIKEKPDILKKVIPVNGNLSKPGLGISDNDRKLLTENVSVVIHSGASVKFNEPLHSIMDINFGGTQKMLELSKEMKKLQAFIYISTAFSQSKKKVLEEIVYPAPAQINEIYKFIKDYGHIEKEVKRFLNGSPNTYAYTKAMCENYVSNSCGHVPSIIVRPSIVTSIKDGPVVGWLDNWGGISGVLDNTSKGWNRVVMGKGHYVPDVIPVDYVANLTIAAGAKFDRNKKVSVYNSCSSTTNPITWAEAYALFTEECIKRGYYHIPYPHTIYSSSKITVQWLTILLQYTPAYLADLGLKLIGKKPKYVEIQNYVVRLRDIIEYYTSHSWQFKSEETRRLYSTLSPEDQDLFPFDASHIDWNQYIPTYCSGIQKHLRCKVDELIKCS